MRSNFTRHAAKCAAVGLLVCCLGAEFVRGQDYVFTMSDASGAPGSSVQSSMLIDNASGTEIQGYAYGACHASAELSLVVVDDGVDLTALSPAFNAVALFPDGYTAGVIFSFLGTVSLGATTGWESHVATYDVIGGPPTSELCFCDTLGSPPTLTTVIVAGAQIVPVQTCGTITVGAAVAQFRRGEVNGDGAFDISDAIFQLAELFAMGPAAPCADAGDTNDDGLTDIADSVLILENLFGSGSPIPDPGAVSCGFDPTPDALDCAASGCP